MRSFLHRLINTLAVQEKRQRIDGFLSMREQGAYLLFVKMTCPPQDLEGGKEIASGQAVPVVRRRLLPGERVLSIVAVQPVAVVVPHDQKGLVPRIVLPSCVQETNSDRISQL